MNKRFRFVIITLCVLMGVLFLKPSFQWYFTLNQEDKALANGSREQIREYAQKQAAKDLTLLKDLVVEDSSREVPEEMSFLQKKARENYKLEERDMPEDWSVETVLLGFRSGNEVFQALENHYSDKILGLKELRNKTIQLGLDLSGGMSVAIQADEESLAERLGEEPTEDDIRDAVARAMEILNNRIDKFGVTEPQIRRQGMNEILIEIPGEADPERVRSFLRGKGRLNFHLVDMDATDQLSAYIRQNPEKAFAEDGTPKNPDFLEKGYEIRGYYKKDRYEIDQLQQYMVVASEVGLDGSHIKNAEVSRDPVTSKPIVNFYLDKEGGDIFFKFTSKNEGKPMAIVMDDKIKAYARISEPIRDSVRMTGFTQDESRDLALVLRTAALPVDLTVMNQQAVGASLGEDTINAGLQAILYGFIAVMIFMVLYYKAAGLVANVALLLNLFFMTAILSAFNMTLTMTSIAGVILNVGMAVDANVIIFERIREELRQGKSRIAAVESGFKKAFWTVMDANITTLIAALFLSQLGKGPIQGFAVTLAVGIVCSLFTAIFVSRLFFDFGSDVLKRRKISIGWGLEK